MDYYFVENISNERSLLVTDYFSDADQDNIVWTNTLSNTLTLDYNTDVSSWTLSRNEETLTTSYTNTFTAYDYKEYSSESLEISLHIEDGIQFTTVPSNTTLFVADISSLVFDTNKSNATLSISDTNLTIVNNELSFKETAVKKQGQHIFTVQANNTSNEIIETITSPEITIIAITKVKIVSDIHTISNRGTTIFSYADIFTQSSITILNASGLVYNNNTEEITIEEYSLPDGVTSYTIEVEQANAFDNTIFNDTLSMVIKYVIP